MIVGDVNIETNRLKKKDSTKKNNFTTQLKDYFTEYSENSGIHGIKYLGEQNRTISEKIWWFTALLAALYLCVTLIIRTYQKWESSPVIVSFATKETPIWQIPFPAVTICPETKSLPTAFNYTDMLYKKLQNRPVTEDEELKFSYIASLCTYHPELTYNLNDFVDAENMFEFLEKVSPKFLENISDCFYMGHAYNCSDIFTPIVTDEGLCYAFNLLNRENILSDTVLHYNNYHSLTKYRAEWSLEHGYKNSAGKNTYPRRALHAGALFDFELKIQTLDNELDFTCGSSIQGYKIQIHHPAMLPRVKQQHFRIPLDQAVIAATMPTMIQTSEAVKSYKPERRQCYFPSERNLKYFKIYTQQNCQIECKTNYTLKVCGCVDFYMPREKGTKICGAPLKVCMQEAEDQLLSEGIETNIRHVQGLQVKNDILHQTINKCDCMPECTSMTYIVENSQSEWDWVRKYQFDPEYSQFNKSKMHMSYLQVFFKDFLANFGGLLGLFTGFSLLSSVEILYYLSLRLICNIKLYGIRYWSGKHE
ncbi:pickpocket protein 28-like [Zophobas morio]|uniref:pickpocket protein 28-like n=1 Tax=Zophobas morio TaxID=2755281 RepID=UPI003083C57C